MSKHIASAEGKFQAVNIAPDFCTVDGKVVPFDIYQKLPPEKVGYAHTVITHGCPTLVLTSVVSGVIGNAGSGVTSGVSLGGGDVITRQGAPTVNVEGQPVCRHQDLVGMNAK